MNPFNNAPVFFIEETTSTMDEALKIIKNDFISGTVITAAYQKAGRGRIIGRVWDSSKWDNLLFTLIHKKLNYKRFFQFLYR